MYGRHSSSDDGVSSLKNRPNITAIQKLRDAALAQAQDSLRRAIPAIRIAWRNKNPAAADVSP